MKDFKFKLHPRHHVFPRCEHIVFLAQQYPNGEYFKVTWESRTGLAEWRYTSKQVLRALADGDWIVE